MGIFPATAGPYPVGMRISARGLEFDADLAGPAGAPAVLLLHGFPQGAGMWNLTIPALLDAGLRTVALDQRGYSPGARPAEVDAYRISECVADAAAVLDALDVRSAHVVGHDWGALVGWHLAAGYPERVASLTAVSVPHPRAMADALREDPEQRERSSYVRLFRQLGQAEEVLLADDAARLRRMFAGCPAERIDGYVAAMREPGALTAALNWYRALERTDPDGVGEVVVPTTYIWGDDDTAIGRRAATGCARYVTGPYRFVPLAGVSHWLPDEAPGAVGEEVLRRVDEG